MYDKKMIKIGRVSMGLAIIANFIPAIYVGLRYGEMPGIATILQIWALVAATYGISWIIQPIAYSSCVCNGIVQLYFAGAFRCDICGYCEKRLKNRNLHNRCGYAHYDFRRKNWNPWWCFDTADRTEWYFDYKSLFCKRSEKRGIKLFWIGSESYV